MEARFGTDCGARVALRRSTLAGARLPDTLDMRKSCLPNQESGIAGFRIRKLDRIHYSPLSMWTLIRITSPSSVDICLTFSATGSGS